MSRIIKYITIALAISLSIFQLYTAYFGVLTPLLQRGFHLTLVIILIFLYYPISKSKKWLWIDYLFMLIIFAHSVYIFIEVDTMFYRGGAPNIIDLIFSIALTILMLEATRRVTGWILPILISLFLFYMFFGHLAPGIFKISGMSLNRIVSLLYLSTEGIFGTPLAVAATTIAAFVIFGAFLEATGAGKVFIDISFAIAGKFRGGPAKVAVVSSALTGTLSGSGVANTMTTGVLTIPIMKNVGYKPRVAAAIEAVASTGGSMLPPVMGSAAFIMSEFTGIPYISIVYAAIIPSILYYLSVLLFVDFQAGRKGISSMKKEELPKLSKVALKGFHLYLGFGTLLFLLIVMKVTPVNAALWATIILILTTLVFYHKTVKWTFLIDGLIKGAKGMLMISVACGSAGIVVAAIKLTGIGITLTSFFMGIGEASLFLTLILAMIACIIMGMGLPGNVSYIILGVLIPPALIQLGVPILVAHMFVFYYTCLAPITPPVALASYAGASIAGTDPLLTSLESARIGVVGFLIPFIFIYAPSLILLDNVNLIIIKTILGLISTILIAIVTTGWFKRNIHWLERIFAFCIAVLLIVPNTTTILIGIVCLVVFILLLFIKNDNNKKLNLNNT